MVVVLSLVDGTPLPAQLTPASTGGATALDRVLQRLAEHRRVLIIGAHPDDEDTGLLALMVLGYGADGAYLSLSRGEGGQNLIGEELGVGLGLLRSQELAAARSVDGARQFFTRAYDFGYSRSLEETSQRWYPDSVLKDVLRVVRRFRPHVIVSTWSGTPRDRHGQHHLAGVTAQRAFEVAGDPTVFPELESEEGLTSWSPLALYRSTRFDSTASTLLLETGGLDPRVGRSYHQIAMASRSQHRSQDMGALQNIGPAASRVRLLRDRTGTTDTDGRGGEFFAGIPDDTSWLARFADSLRGAASAARLPEAARPLASALARGSRSGVAPERLELLQNALTISAGLVMDATASRAEMVPGSGSDVVVTVYNAGPFTVAVQRVALQTPSGWVVEPVGSTATALESGARTTWRFRVTVPPNARPTQPYYLGRPLAGSLYDWSTADPVVRGQPFQAPLLNARVEAAVLGATVGLSREVVYRQRDQALGEVRRPLRVVPAIDVKLSPEQVVWSARGVPTRTFAVVLTYNGEEPIRGVVALEAEGWPAPRVQRFQFRRSGESARFAFTLQRPAGIERAEVQVRAVARTDGGGTFDEGVQLVSYPHIRATAWVRPARATVRIGPIALPDVRAVGYVRGAADRVPEALQQVGLPLELLDADGLARADLVRFDAIVIGSRAYETDSVLVRHNDRLLGYVRDGGVLIVQYQQYQYVRGGYAPFPLTIRRPHDRVTDETAPVRLLDPAHPVFATPNKISERDWEGWPQERGLYFANTWDASYLPLLELSDAGMPPLHGGLLIAPYGRGTYVYTGLSFFRALPAGVPGAYRVFANLLALGER